jgi:hypothetical protein
MTPILIPGFDAGNHVLLGKGDILLVAASISDLFFNYQHDGFDEAKKGPPSPLKELGGPVCTEAEYEGAMKDAVEFTSTFEVLTGLQIDRAALLEDFFRRL